MFYVVLHGTSILKEQKFIVVCITPLVSNDLKCAPCSLLITDYIS